MCSAVRFETLKGRDCFGRPRQNCGNHIKINLKLSVDWIYQAQDMIQCRAILR